MVMGGGNGSFVRKLIKVCRDSGIIYRSSYIYGGLKGFVDYGSLGIKLKDNLRSFWFKELSNPYTYKLESSIILNRKVWFASKHSKFFLDYTVDCKFSKKKFKVDSIAFTLIQVGDGKLRGQKTPNLEALTFIININSRLVLKHKLRIFLVKRGFNSTKKVKFSFKNGSYILNNRGSALSLIAQSPVFLKEKGLLNLKKVNLMFLVNVGNSRSAGEGFLFLRPETAQGSFINFLNIKDSFKPKLPFSLIQEGKVFRNEITSKQFSNRLKEFSQLEMHFFLKNNDTLLFIHYKKLITKNYKWFIGLGIPYKKVFLEKIKGSLGLSHYSRFCVDIIFRSVMGDIEVAGIAVRGDFDVKQHSKYSNYSFKFFNKKKNKFFLPYVIEPSIGLDRVILAILENSLSYKTCISGGSKGSLTYFLNFLDNLSPYKLSVFPLVKNNLSIKKKSLHMFNTLSKGADVFYSFENSIGRRYLKSDNMGIPFSVTVDFKSTTKDTVTVRYRNNSRQFTIKVQDAVLFFNNKFN
jgi:glycyl-tRNA synthetase